jgi:hypothetical protein
MREQMSSAEYHRAALSLAWRSATKAGLRKEIARWRDVHTRIEGFLANVEAERRYALHYEDLVTQPQQEIGHLCDFLGIDVESSMFDPQANTPKGLEWGLGDESIRERAGIDARSVDRWRDELSPSSLDSETHALMARLGIADESASLSPALQ